jgi:predicted nuclease of predicted toxin-antitoxin system
MKLLIDMNLSPQWVKYLEDAGHLVKHWSDVGAHDAPDEKLMEWAQGNGYIHNRASNHHDPC